MTAQDLEQAVEQAKAGMQCGFTTLYESTYRTEYYIALKYMKNEHSAQDVLQNAYMKAFQNLNSLTEPSGFQRWLGVIVANTAKDELRKKNPMLFSDMQGENDEGEELAIQIEDENSFRQPEQAYTQKETQQLVRELLDSLSDEQRMCVLMYHIEGLSINEIAEILGCSANTVKSRLNYGRKNIKVQAEELQRKGVKLYTAAPLTLLFFLMDSESKAMQVPKQVEKMGEGLAKEIIKGHSGMARVMRFVFGSNTGKIVLGVFFGAALMSVAVFMVLTVMGQNDSADGIAVTGSSVTGASAGPDNGDAGTPASGSATVVEKKKTEEELYDEYLKNVLIPKYNLYPEHKKVKTVPDDSFSMYTKKKDVPTGIIATDIEDLNGDQVKELLMFYRTKKKTDGAWHGSGLLYQIYTIKEQQVELYTKGAFTKTDGYSSEDFSVEKKKVGNKSYYFLTNRSYSLINQAKYSDYTYIYPFYFDGSKMINDRYVDEVYGSGYGMRLQGNLKTGKYIFLWSERDNSRAKYKSREKALKKFFGKYGYGEVEGEELFSLVQEIPYSSSLEYDSYVFKLEDKTGLHENYTLT